MSKFQKIRSIAFAILMILGALIMVLDPEDSYSIVVTILGILLLISGLGSLYYFLTMARNMVGGKLLLYKGVILTDFGYLTTTINDVPRIYVLFYLAGLHAFTGLVQILRAMESRSYGSSWKLKFFHGVVDIFIAISCFIFAKKADTAVYIYAFGLVSSAVMRIATALRKQQVEPTI